MNSLRETLVSIVESEWPLTFAELEECDEQYGDLCMRDDERLGSSERTGWPLHLLPEPAAAIALAIRFDIPSILPAAYYDLSRCTADIEWDKHMHADIGFDGHGKPARWDLLPAKAYRKLLIVQTVIRKTTYMLQCSFRTHSPCQSQPVCEGAWSKIRQSVSICHIRNDILRTLPTKNSVR